MSIHALRLAGNHVMVLHRRRYWDKKNKRWAFLYPHARKTSSIPAHVEAEPRGGITELHITTSDKQEFIGVAKCSNDDNYSKKIGVDAALSDFFAKLLKANTTTSVTSPPPADITWAWANLHARATQA